MPVFKSFAVLAIPSIGIQPSLDEIQQYLNKSVQLIVNVSKNITQWTKGQKFEKKKPIDPIQITQKRSDSVIRELVNNGEELINNNDSENNNSLIDPTSSSSPINNNSNVPIINATVSKPQKTYYKSVSENKDIAKLVSLLFTCISSTKKDVVAALDRFKEYQFIWQKDRDEDLKEFAAEKRNPRVGEYESRIKEFEQLIEVINSLPEFIPVGAVALVTEKLKLGLTGEICLWKTSYGLACNQKYKKEINEILLFIEDIMKRLQREIKDLDDIRLINIFILNY